MLARSLFAAAIAGAGFAALPTAVPPSARHSVRLNGQTFSLPAGFEIELVAGPPLVDRPVHADFDERGFLYVADSSGSNDPVQKQLEAKPHRVVRLQDSTGSGCFDKSTVFADALMLPQGAMWHAGSLYVAAPPSIWKLTDSTDDGVADRREEWHKGQTLTNCANDLHGPYLGPDGWFYWCKGAFAEQSVERAGKVIQSKAAHIFRAKPDGSKLETVLSGGMDNPVEIAFTPSGEMIFTTTFFQHPAGGRRDGLIHGIYGGIYGKDHAVIRSHFYTGPDLMPVMTHMGAAAPAGLMRYESTAFGEDYRDNLFAAQFNMHKVSRHVLVPDGSTFKTIDSDFLVSDNFDFHPTDVLEDADGSLLVLDTGGWYKLCCPTSQLAKPDVKGAIYRIRKTGTAKLDDPRGLQLKWDVLTVDELIAALDDVRPAVRKRAIAALAAQGKNAVQELRSASLGKVLPRARRDAVWAAARIDDPTARTVAEAALITDSDEVRQAALHSMALHRDGGRLARLQDLLEGESAMNRRAAAEALGRSGTGFEALLKRLEAGNTRTSEHSIISALHEIGRTGELERALAYPNSSVRRAALIVLDQQNPSKLQTEQVVRELSHNDPRMWETAWWIAARHPEWGDAVAGVLRVHLRDDAIAKAQAGEIENHLAIFAGSLQVQRVMADLLQPDEASQAARMTILKAMGGARLKIIPAAWIDRLLENLRRDDDAWTQTAHTIRGLKASADQARLLNAALYEIGADTRIAARRRRLALAAIAKPTLSDAALFALCMDGLGIDVDSADRAVSVSIIASAKLNASQLIAITAALKSIGPLEIDRLLEAFAQSEDAKVGDALLAALNESPLRSSLRVDRLRPLFAKFGADVAKRAETLYALIDVDAEKRKVKLEELLPKVKNGDVRRGQVVYTSPKATCTACHAMGYLGGTTGPDLSRIGGIRTERDLLESIIFPSASFVRSYEPVQVSLKDGAVRSGIIRAETPTEITLQMDAEKQVRLAREEIEEIKPGQVSLMPTGLDQQLTSQELADLVAFLKSRK